MDLNSNQGTPGGYQNQVTTNSDSLRTITLVTYILFAVGYFNGLTTFVGLIIAYLKRAESRGTIYESHLTWLIRTFWISLIVGIIGAATSFLLIGIPILIADAIWGVYRLVKGFLAFNDRKPIANPTGWF